MGERYVVLGVAPARSPWFREVAHWATAAVLPLDFVKCVSVEEARARLASGRAFSVLLADAAVAGLDRDLIDVARTAGCAVLVVHDERIARDWVALGASAVLTDHLDRSSLLAALSEHAIMLGGPESSVTTGPLHATASRWQGRLVAVTGGGGSGTSTVAMALATGLGRDVRHRGQVALADLALHADQAFLHDAGDIVPGVQELVEAHRAGTPSAEDVRALTFDGPRPYRLLLGLRRHRDWASLRPRAFLAALDSLLRAFTVVVADVDCDLEGERECGSVEVEERNLMARSVLPRADLVAVTARTGPIGLHGLVRDVHELLRHEIAPETIVPVLTGAARHPRVRAEHTRALADLLAPSLPPDQSVQPPLFVSGGRRLDAAIRVGAPPPAAPADQLATELTAVLDRVATSPVPPPPPEPERVVPGSLGAWSDEPTGT